MAKTIVSKLKPVKEFDPVENNRAKTKIIWRGNSDKNIIIIGININVRLNHSLE